MTERFTRLFARVLLSSLAVVSTSLAMADNSSKGNEKVFYRYKNEQDVSVIAQSVPPQYVRKGYEVVTLSGEVLKVIPPAPADADAERVAREKKLAKEQERADAQLRRSYSAVAEIDAAKTRNLQQLHTNIDVLQANLLGVKSQLKNQETHAATLERNGQKVSDEILNNIKTLRADEKDLNAQIKQRETEYQAVSDKYDEDKKRFIEITKPKSK